MTMASTGAPRGAAARSDRRITVFGAAGRTGRFVVAELRRRGLAPILSGRNAARLDALADAGSADVRVATVDDPASLDRALAGAAAVISLGSDHAHRSVRPRPRGGPRW